LKQFIIESFLYGEALSTMMMATPLRWICNPAEIVSDELDRKKKKPPMPTIKLKTTINAPIERCFLLSLSVDVHQLSTQETRSAGFAILRKLNYFSAI
jgi:hypothetical protein